MAETMDTVNGVVSSVITKVYARRNKAVRKVNIQEPNAEIQEIRHLGFDQDLVGNKRKRKTYDDNELMFLAAGFDNGQELEPENIIWAKVTGHPMWPALILNDSNNNIFVGKLKQLNKNQADKSLLVQFFGTTEFARVRRNQVKPFLEGLVSGFHLKCKKASFATDLHEAKAYLSEQKLPETMPGTRKEAKTGKILRKSCRDFAGLGNYRLVDLKRDLDKCDVCQVDEECENNMFLQCDKCRIMVHPRCYGESEATDGCRIWLCKLYRPGAPAKTPPCCLCPVTGGANKPTTDGRWAHLACAIWIPETCLADVKKMEPVDGLTGIHKDRWKLLCYICGVAYGVCVQCSRKSCCVAYHPLCALAAGYFVEVDEKDDESLKLLSFCKKHGPASAKRLYVENRPHLVGGFTRNKPRNLENKGSCQHGMIPCMVEKYKYMKQTMKQRLAFGKSGIHGFGIFANRCHRAGDMMIEYVRETVRSSVADRRERVMYNSIVGAGTYMFKVDEDRVVDATRAGSMAHLINHSCDPNCFSRIIGVNGGAYYHLCEKGYWSMGRVDL